MSEGTPVPYYTARPAVLPWNIRVAGMASETEGSRKPMWYID